jgi:endo-1,4-beta-D-glucanase Y
MVKKMIIAGAMLTFCFSALAAPLPWNLRYVPSDKYDYSQYYAKSLYDKLYLNPTMAKKRLYGAWQYYKTNFIASNGLVVHKRHDNNGNVIGTNEAVSEGIGYGMLLALLVDDQPAFNKIFEAGNKYMSNGTVYKPWSVRWDANNPNSVQTASNGAGAATDADLDIALALIFANKLVEKKVWTNYDYKTRALALVKAIRNTMTQNDYLLPGDSWGGNALSNLNPSYFAVAWMKVFDKFQTEVSFKSVIDKCYQVIQSCPRYNVGQVPDWCTTSGAESGSTRGMLNDAVRVPWRIAMDALWYGDSRAIEYCKKTKGTLSLYNNAETVEFVEQFAQYSSSGSPIADTKQSCNNVAMWACAVLGAKEAGYTEKALSWKVVGKILEYDNSSTTLPIPFGSKAWSDEDYYYKQSLALLGFATLTGQFPNIFEDEVIPLNPVTLSVALKATPTIISFPGTVNFTATLSGKTPWTLTIKGRTSGKSVKFDDSTAAISVSWNGDGFLTKEVVDAVLTGAQINDATPLANLKASVSITPSSAVIGVSPAGKTSFSILQNSHGLLINPGDNLMPNFNIYSLSGKCVFSHRFNMQQRYNRDHSVTIPDGTLNAGHYIAVLSTNGISSSKMVRRFIWQ